jgi:large subunit ribosomal protein L15
MPFYRRIPKRGFVNPTRVEYEPVNLADLAKLEADTITVQILRERGLVRRNLPVKILGEGEVSRPLVVTAQAFSKSAREKIEKAGGRAEVAS